MASNKTDLTNQTFGRLIVIRKTDKRFGSVIGKKNGNGSFLWECLCSCGGLCYYTGSQLRRSKDVKCSTCHANKIPLVKKENI